MIKASVLIVLLVTNVVAGFTQSSSNLRADGTIMLKGQPFFPFGMYSTPWTSGNSDRMKCLRTMIDAGLNVAFIEDNGHGDIIPLLDTADFYNFHFLIGTPHSPNIIGTANYYKDRKSVFAWSLSDDGDNGTSTVEELLGRNSSVKSADPNHLTYLTITGFNLSRRNSADLYTPITDVPAYQIYPVGQQRNADYITSNALTETYNRTLLYVTSSKKANRPLIMNCQTFSWGSQSDNPRYPDVLELRNMIYSGLAAGIKGIISYDFSFDLVNNHPDLWDEFKKIRNDVRAMDSVYLDGKITRVYTGDPEVAVSYWEYKNNCYVVVVNTSYTYTKNVSISIPASYGSPITSLFPRMFNTLSLSGRNLAGSVPAKEVVVYKLRGNLTAIKPLVTNASEVDIYPNPVCDGTFNISIKDLLNGDLITVIIFDTYGNLVYDNKKYINKEIIYCNNLKRGFYILKVNRTDKNYLKKMIIY